MQTRHLYNSAVSQKTGKSLFARICAAVILVILMASFLPLSSVYAAPASDHIDGDTLGQEWANKLSMVRMENLFYAQVKLFPVDFKSSSDMARPYDLLAKYGSALKQANEIILKHTGFDEKGEVINEEQAQQSVQDLGECLHTMRGAMDKLEEEGYPFHRVK